MKLFSTDLSPILADIDDLKGMPETYFIIVEDSQKDPEIVYASKIKKAGSYDLIR